MVLFRDGNGKLINGREGGSRFGVNGIDGTIWGFLPAKTWQELTFGPGGRRRTHQAGNGREEVHAAGKGVNVRAPGLSRQGNEQWDSDNGRGQHEGIVSDLAAL